MKILIVTHYFLPHMGGIELVAYNQAKELVKMGNNVTVISSRLGNSKKIEYIDGIKVVRVTASNFFEKFGVPYPIFSPSLIKTVKKEILDSNLIIIHDMSYISSFLASLISKINKKDYILYQHVKKIETKNKIVNLIQSSVFSTTGKYIKKNSKKIIVCNEIVGNWLDEKDKTHFVRNGVDINLFKTIKSKDKEKLRKRYGLPVDKKIVLFVGRLVEKKGFDKLFNAKDDGYLILMVGDGHIPEHMKNDKNVRFIQALPQNKLREIYQLSDLFCLPSKNEGFPLTILEAMASGLPIITSNHPGYDKYLDKKHVKLIEPKPINIKKAISEVLKSKKMMKDMSKYSRKSAINDFSWTENVIKLLKISKNE